MTGFRAPDFRHITRIMLLRLDGHALTMREKTEFLNLAFNAPNDEGVAWGPSRRAIKDLLSIINEKRRRDGRELMCLEGLKQALRLFIEGKSKDALAEEFHDALCNLREARMSVFKILPPEDTIKRIA